MKIGINFSHIQFGIRRNLITLSPLGSLVVFTAALFLCTSNTLHAAKPFGPKYVEKYYNEALDLEPNLDNGRKLYKFCVACHGPEGWGTKDGTYPQIAGQLKNVIIKQMDDIRAGNRDNPIMRAFTSVRVLAGPQEIADVSGYIANLPMSTDNGRGRSEDEEAGEEIYKIECAECHGDKGQGDEEEIIPLIQSQHYEYLIRQFEWIRNGRRRNADIEMVKQIRRFSFSEEQAVIAYTASLKPDRSKWADPDWKNPDFEKHVRGWRKKIK